MNTADKPGYVGKTALTERQEIMRSVDELLNKNNLADSDDIDALLELAERHGLEKVYVHCFLDGRDTPPESGKRFISKW